MAFATFLALVSVTSNAFAQAPWMSVPAADPAVEEESPFETRWYGYQILLVDLASVVATPFEPRLGVGGMYLGAPLVHVANGQGKQALISGGLRVGLTLGGAMLGAALAPEPTCRSEDGLCLLEPMVAYSFAGAVVGLGTAMVLDWTVLSNKKVLKEGYALAPTASVTPQGVNIGLVGRF